MQTVLLTIWPFLNLLLFAGLYGALIRFITARFTTRIYQFAALLVLLGIVLLASRTITTQDSQTFTFLTPQPTVPVSREAYHDGILIDASTFSVKSHEAVWPVTLPNVMQPTDSTSREKADALKVTFTVTSTNLMPGLTWTTDLVNMRVMPNKQVSFETSGYITWRLLGLPVYKQEKTYKGTAKM